MKEYYRSYVTLALVCALLVLVHLLLQHGACRRWSLVAVTVPRAVDPPPTVPLPPSTTPIQVGNVTVKRKPVKLASKHLAAAKYVPGHVITHSELCPQLGAKVLVMVMVTSAPGNFAARQAIRISWGTQAAKLNFPLAFILGQHQDKQTEVNLEDAQYGDLVIGNFIDSYTNLTLKSLSTLEWMSKYCPRAAFLMKIDDDVFLNVLLLHKYARARVNETRSIWGYLHRIAFPCRSLKLRYHVAVSEYPGRLFPPFMSGVGYLMSGDCIGPVLRVAGELRYVSLEDVFVTGLAAARVGLRRRHSERFKVDRHTLTPPCELRQLLLVHEVRPRDHLELWWRLHDPDVTCPPHHNINQYYDRITY